MKALSMIAQISKDNSPIGRHLLSIQLAGVDSRRRTLGCDANVRKLDFDPSMPCKTSRGWQALRLNSSSFSDATSWIERIGDVFVDSSRRPVTILVHIDRRGRALISYEGVN